jgi:hypothetical protein
MRHDAVPRGRDDDATVSAPEVVHDVVGADAREVEHGLDDRLGSRHVDDIRLPWTLFARGYGECERSCGGRTPDDAHVILLCSWCASAQLRQSGGDRATAHGEIVGNANS